MRLRSSRWRSPASCSARSLKNDALGRPSGHPTAAKSASCSAVSYKHTQTNSQRVYLEGEGGREELEFLPSVSRQQRASQPSQMGEGEEGGRGGEGRGGGGRGGAAAAASSTRTSADVSLKTSTVDPLPDDVGVVVLLAELGLAARI